MLTGRPSIATVVMATCALAMTIMVGWREISGNGAPRTSVAQPEILVVDNWEELASGPLRLGPVDAPATMVVFADFECPACRSFVLQALPQLKESYGDDLAVVFRHWPLDYHRFAYPAARAAECAAAQGYFWSYHDRLYQAQDSLGLKSFETFASEAGVPDLLTFSECNADTASVPDVDRDAAMALALRATGTPTVIINGSMLARGASGPVVIRLIEEALGAAGR